MKKILFVTGGSDSGSEHALFDLVSSLSPQEAEINVFARYDDYFNHHAINCERYFSEESFLKGRGLLSRVIERSFYKNQYFPYSRFFRNILSLSKPDLIYCNFLTIPQTFDFFLEQDIPLVIHGHALQQYLYAYSFPMLEKRLKRARLVLSSSETQKKVLTGLAPGINTRVIYPPIKLNELAIDEASRNLLRQRWNIPRDAMIWAMASTYFNYNKDPDRFVEIGKRILSKGDDKHYFLWIGGDPESTALKYSTAKLAEVGLTSNFIFTGDCNHQDYIKYLGAADALMLVSLEESFSLVTAEAIALGKPVIAFNCGGVSEFITDINGILVPPFSLDQMAEAAVRMTLMRNSYKSELMLDSVKRFDLGVQSSKWKELIFNL
ncbi:MAG: glycosyltransferase family 4 protein [Bacteroidales bacterium]